MTWWEKNLAIKKPACIIAGKQLKGVGLMPDFKHAFEHETFEEFREAYKEFLEKHPDLKHAREAYVELEARI